MFSQLHHPGRETLSVLNGKNLLISASNQACGFCAQPTREMTTDEVREMIEKFVSAAVRVQKSGYDGVELHCAHGYLLQQFLSPYTNHRTDEYGGSLENRMRMLSEIVTGIRERCGNDFPISVRLTADEFLDLVGNPAPCLKLEETTIVAKKLEELGVNVINVSCGLYETANTCVEPVSFPEGWRAYLIKAIKESVSIPVMGVTVIRNPEFAEGLLEDGNQDFISMGRSHLADPEWVKKTQEGRENEIRKCINCLHCFETYTAGTVSGEPVECALNPTTAHETCYDNLRKDGDDRAVAVVGAGPAGMEAARVLALRGFRPILFEANSYPGGQMNFADKPPMKERITALTKTMETQLKALNVEIHYDTRSTADALIELKPYAVIVATGGEAIVPGAIPGIHNQNVYINRDILSGKIVPEEKNLAVIGAGHAGLETADYLAARGYNIKVFEMANAIGPDMYIQNLIDMQLRLAANKVEFFPSHILLGIEENTIHTQNVESLQNEDFTMEGIVLSLGTKSVNSLLKELNGVIENIIAVGDAINPAKIGQATRSGYDAAYNL
jgi:2,4-dienoyl-CoA reductase-like NADH-dependent reductase (Old Yellow Enzyme family)/thioredoxin reductase